jgi:RNA polymerase sigma-70 factor (ECF subfamily)
MIDFKRRNRGAKEPAAAETLGGSPTVAPIEETVPAERPEFDREAEALARCRAGDRDAYRILVEAHRKGIASVISRIVLNPQETEDLTQETFIQAYCKLSSFRGESGFGTWLYRIAVNLSLRRLEKLRKTGWTPLEALERGEIPDLRPDAPNPEREALLSEDRNALRSALLRLSDEHRAVITLHYFEELSGPEIARIMGCSVGTVWSRLHYALRRLKKLLDAHEGGG